MAWNNTFLIIALTGFVLVIIMIIWRLRSKIKKEVPGSDKMSTREMVKRWKDDKAQEDEFKASLRLEEKEAALRQSEQLLRERYRQEEIDRLTSVPKPTNFGNALGEKVGDPNKLREMIGRPNNDQVFNPNKMREMIGNQPNPRNVAGYGGSMNYQRGVDKAMNSKTRVDVDSILYRR